MLNIVIVVMEMKKIGHMKMINILLILIVIVDFVLFLFLTGKKIYQSVQNKKVISMNALDVMISFVLSDISDEVYQVEMDEDVDSEVDTFSENYQVIVDNKIRDLMIEPYSFEEPFLMIDPYNTNTTAINIYFEDEGVVEYTVHVEDDSIPDYTNTLYQTKVENNYGSSIIGLVAGYENEVHMTLTLEDGTVKENDFVFNMKNIKNSGNVSTTLEVEEGNSVSSLEDGLYAVLGHDKNYNADIYLYDNNGVLRSELNLEDYRTDRIIFTDDDSIIYSSNEDELIKVNSLGKIEQTYYLGDYEMHHDYRYNEDHERLLILASKKESETIEDCIISLNLRDGSVKEIIDMKDLLPEMYKKAFHPEENDYGGSELDWVHLNSIDFIDEDSIVVSSRELSSVIAIDNIYNEPTIRYILSVPEMYEGTSYSDLVYQKNGDFTASAGQHSVVYEEDDSLPEGSYYLYMYNNNYGGSATLPDFDFTIYFPGVGNYQEGEASYYYQYLVNETDKTFTLVKKIPVDYSSIVSSSQELGDNIITSSGLSHLYAEYDQDGDLIRKFKYTSKKFAYRVFKYDFNDFWFEETTA